MALGAVKLELDQHGKELLVDLTDALNKLGDALNEYNRTRSSQNAKGPRNQGDY